MSSRRCPFAMVCVLVKCGLQGMMGTISASAEQRDEGGWMDKPTTEWARCWGSFGMPLWACHGFRPGPLAWMLLLVVPISRLKDQNTQGQMLA